MANTDLSYYASDVIDSGDPIVLWRRAGDANIKAGYVVEDEDGLQVKVCGASSGIPFAVAGLKVDQDIDTAYTEDESIPLIVDCAIVWVKHDGTSETVYHGAPMDASGGTLDGAVSLFETIYAEAGTWVQGTLAGCIGRAMSYKATGGTAVWIKLKLGV